MAERPATSAATREGRSFAAYCFWAQAEDGAMNRAVATPVDGGPTLEDLDRRFVSSPRRSGSTSTTSPRSRSRPKDHWDSSSSRRRPGSSGATRTRAAKRRCSGTKWRRAATRPRRRASRQRILDYNEDDCRATKALRDWLNGPAKALAHRDDPL